MHHTHPTLFLVFTGFKKVKSNTSLQKLTVFTGTVSSLERHPNEDSAADSADCPEQQRVKLNFIYLHCIRVAEEISEFEISCSVK